MNRGDVKLMIDRLVQVGTIGKYDQEIVDQSCDMLLELSAENARLRALTTAQDGQLSILREQQYTWTQAAKTIESEREANAALTDQCARWEKFTLQWEKSYEECIKGQLAHIKDKELIAEELASCILDLDREVSVGNDYLMQITKLKAELAALKEQIEVWDRSYSELAKQVGILEAVTTDRDAWQPIETAPNNGLPRLYLIQGFCVQGFIDVTGELMIQSEISPHWRMARSKPSNWMPLPAAPTMQEGK